MSLNTPMRRSGVPAFAAAPHIRAGAPATAAVAQMSLRNSRLFMAIVLPEDQERADRPHLHYSPMPSHLTNTRQKALR